MRARCARAVAARVAGECDHLAAAVWYAEAGKQAELHGHLLCAMSATMSIELSAPAVLDAASTRRSAALAFDAPAVRAYQ